MTSSSVSQTTDCGLAHKFVRMAPLLRSAFHMAGLLVAAGMLHAHFYPETGDPVADAFYLKQDWNWLAALVVFFAAAPLLPMPRLEKLWEGVTQRRWLAAAIALAFCLAWFGFRGFFYGYPVSRDEDMADFDASVFLSGRLMAPVPEMWRGYFRAMGTIYMQPVSGDAYWASQYLPVNAALRALADRLGDRSLHGALLAVLALSCVYGVARKLWPTQRDAAFAAVMLTALSPQFLVNAMTPYAMTAHLALNMAWLLLFLRNDARGHVGAIVVGFLAAGLHQFVFHPLFAAPFVLQLLLQRRLRVAAVYILGYGAICLFWTKYPALALHVYQDSGAANAPAVGLPERVAALFAKFDGGETRVMIRNLLRFVGWQHIMMAPLFVMGCLSLRRAPAILWPLAAGIALTFGLAFVMMPYQGYGWGYRYLHGLIGSCALIAAWGFVVLRQAVDGAFKAHARSLFIAASAVTLLALVPARIAQVREMVQPYASALAAIRSTDADVVLVDSTGYRMAVDLVRNQPDLRNRPVILDLKFLKPGQAKELCAAHSVGLFDAAHARAYGIEAYESLGAAVEMAARIRGELLQADCGARLALPG